LMEKSLIFLRETGERLAQSPQPGKVRLKLPSPTEGELMDYSKLTHRSWVSPLGVTPLFLLLQG